MVETKDELSEVENQHRIIMMYIWLALRFPHFDQVEYANQQKDICETIINGALHRLSGRKKSFIIEPKTAKEPQETKTIATIINSSRDDEY